MERGALWRLRAMIDGEGSFVAQIVVNYLRKDE
jgi:hypothetical protein